MAIKTEEEEVETLKFEGSQEIHKLLEKKRLSGRVTQRWALGGYNSSPLGVSLGIS